MEILHNIDFYLFELINNKFTNFFFDWILPIFRNKNTWIPLYIAMIVYLIYTFKLKSIWIILLALVSIGIADGLSSHIIKPFIERLRPCNVSEIADILQLKIPNCSTGFSFPSSHATNHFALASFIGIVLKNHNHWILRIGMIWAAVISYAQIYVGVHFPIDVFSGAILGIGIGVFLNVLYQKIPLEYKI